MFTVQENEYILGLINVYKELGYKYYIVHTVTVENNVYDLCFYFSSETIEAISADSFKVNKAHIVYVDSSARSDNNYNPSTHSRDKLENAEYTGYVVVNTAEFIYTNAEITYPLTTEGFEVNPDICKTGVMNYENSFLSYVIIFILLIQFLYKFVLNIIRLKRT